MPDRPRADIGRLKRETDEKIRVRGLAPKNVIREAEPGALFEVDGDAFSFPEEQVSGNRTAHDFRRAIVLSCRAQCMTMSPKSITVIPCTASHRGACSPFDFEIPDDEPSFTAPRVVALVHLAQPILKSRLHKHLGDLRPETFARLLAVVARNFGMTSAPTGSLPPRPDGI